MHVIVLDKRRLASGKHVAHPLKADTGATIVDHEAVMYPVLAIAKIGLSVLAELITPETVDLVVVDVAVADVHFIYGLDASSRKAEEVGIVGSIKDLRTVKESVATGHTHSVRTRDLDTVEHGLVAHRPPSDTRSATGLTRSTGAADYADALETDSSYAAALSYRPEHILHTLRPSDGTARVGVVCRATLGEGRGVAQTISSPSRGIII